MAIKSMNGARGWACYQAYVSFIYFITHAKTYRTGFESREEMLEHFKSLDDEQKKAVIFEIMSVCPISDSDMIKLVGVHATSQGGFVTTSTASNYSIKDLADMVVESILECSRISQDVFF
ncbi:TPA: hypothetical protein ACMD15_003391, partial [Vibrio cholerae]